MVDTRLTELEFKLLCRKIYLSYRLMPLLQADRPAYLALYDKIVRTHVNEEWFDKDKIFKEWQSMHHATQLYESAGLVNDFPPTEAESKVMEELWRDLGYIEDSRRGEAFEDSPEFNGDD